MGIKNDQTQSAATRMALEKMWGAQPAASLENGCLYAGGGKAEAASGQTAAVLLTNPADSGRMLVVHGWWLAADVAAEVAYVDDATSALATTPVVQLNQMYALVPSKDPVGQIQIGANHVTGGTELAPKTLLAPEITVGLPMPVIVAPGHSFAVQATASALGTLALYATGMWSETIL